MKKIIVLSILMILLTSVTTTPSYAEKRNVTFVSNASIISEGLYFNILKTEFKPKQVIIEVEAKNRAFLSQAIYFELVDAKGTKYLPQKQGTKNIFKPLKLNRAVKETYIFDVKDEQSNYKLNLYSKDIFKKHKKTLITQMELPNKK